MDLRDFGSTLARWWYLTLATILLAIGAAYGLYASAGATYSANSTVLLLPPKAVLLQQQQDGKNYAPNNPLLYLGTLTDTRDVLVRNLSSKDVLDGIKKSAPDAAVTIGSDATSGSPLILIKSTGNSETAALAGVKAVDALVPTQLKTLQDQLNIQALQRIDSIKVTEDSKATASHKTAIELAVVGFAGVLVLGLALIALIDHLRNRRNRGNVEPSRSQAQVTSGSGATGARPVANESTTSRTGQQGATTAAAATGANAARTAAARKKSRDGKRA